MLYVMGTIREDFGERVRYWRKRRGLSGEKLAEAIGIAPNSLYSLERGEQWASSETVEKLGDALDVPVRDLFDFGATATAPAPTPEQALAVLAEAIRAPRVLSTPAANKEKPQERKQGAAIPPEILELLEGPQAGEFLAQLQTVAEPFLRASARAQRGDKPAPKSSRKP